jgi:hypothetical protein
MSQAMRRGILFSIDALLAALLLVGGLLLILQISDHTTDTTQLATASQDAIVALEAVKIIEIGDAWVQSAIANGTIPDPNITAVEQIGYFWAIGDAANAQQLASILLGSAYPSYGLRLSLENSTIYERNSTRGGQDIVAASRMVSGVAQGKAVTGSSAVAYLRRIKDKRTSSFTTFGGFVGQGNVTVQFLDLPADANISSIRLELSAGAPFTVRFNNVACGATYTPATFNGTPSSWDLSSCNASLVPGTTNNISIRFTSALNQSYITGGHLRIKYKTSTLGNSFNNTFVQYHFPGIQGVANLYDAFYVPGTLKNMSVYLHYNATNSTYFNIGEKRVWTDSPNSTEVMIVLNDSYLRDPSLGRLDYDFLSNKTVPIRFAGFSPNNVVVTSGDADVVIITDFTGSMKKAVVDWDQGNLGSTCANAYSDNDVRRTLLAQCVDKEMIDTVMNYSGNRVWPVFMHDDQVKWYNNPTDKTSVKGYIDSYSNGKGKTCLACAINQAYAILANFSNSSRSKFIVIMTDGCPTHCASGSCSSNSTVYGTLQCQGMCDTSGACDASDIPGQCTECTSNPGGQTNAYLAANRSRRDLNVTIFTVGFGPVDDCAYGNTTLRQIAAIGNGTYQHSKSSAQLRAIYNNISQTILSQTTYSSQTVITDGGQAASHLYEDSYINITYELASQYLPKQNTISLTLQSDQACNPVVALYPEQQLIEAKAISYSGVHWSDYLAVNGIEAYNLSSFLVPYTELGDPTAIQPPVSSFMMGNNTFMIETGDSPANRTACSVNNSVIYTVIVNLSTERSVVVPNATGCIWSVQFEDDTFENITIPSAYAGTRRCSYTAANISYDDQDAYQVGAYAIFNRLDFKKEGKIFVNLRDEDLEVIVTTISRVPYMWGPSTMRLEVIR